MELRLGLGLQLRLGLRFGLGWAVRLGVGLPRGQGRSWEWIWVRLDIGLGIGVPDWPLCVALPCEGGEGDLPNLAAQMAMREQAVLAGTRQAVQARLGGQPAQQFRRGCRVLVPALGAEGTVPRQEVDARAALTLLPGVPVDALRVGAEAVVAAHGLPVLIRVADREAQRAVALRRVALHGPRHTSQERSVLSLPVGAGPSAGMTTETRPWGIGRGIVKVQRG